MSEIIQLNSQAKLSEHFKLGEMTRSNSHPEVYNIPSHEATCFYFLYGFFSLKGYQFGNCVAYIDYQFHGCKDSAFS